MTIGLMLLRSILEAGAQTTLRQCYPIWFSQEERVAFDYVLAHTNRHGRMPSLEALGDQGLRLPRATEPCEYYMDRVRNRAVFTQLEALHPSFMEHVKNRDMEGAIGALRMMLANASAVSPSQDMTTIIEQGALVLAEYERAHQSFTLTGVPLGWQCVDTATEGGQPGDVIVLAGRPNVGKTYGMLWVLRRAWLEGRSVLLCSMEMDPSSITRRIIGIQSGLNPRGIRSGRLSTWGHGMMRDTVAGFDDLPPLNIITGNFRKRTSDINKAAEELQPDLIVVDAGYLVTPDKKAARSARHEDIANVIEELKGVAASRRRPLFTTVQLNREVKRTHRADLDLANLAGSDAIAQVASIVIAMRYGDSPYESTRRRWEIIKNREGPLIKYETTYGFAPVDLSFTRIIVDDVEEDQQNRPDTRHMI